MVVLGVVLEQGEAVAKPLLIRVRKKTPQDHRTTKYTPRATSYVFNMFVFVNMFMRLVFVVFL